MSPGIQYVFLVVDAVIGDLVLFWAVLGEEILSLVVHGVGHYVFRLLPDDCSVGYPCYCLKSDASVVRRLKSRHIPFGVDRHTGFSVPAKGVHAVISIIYCGRGEVVA